MAAYEPGVAAVERLQAEDGDQVNPACRTRLLAHGRRTQRAAVLLHGFTNCPQQFLRLGETLHERGWNVLIPRYPLHGDRDRLSTQIAGLQPRHLLDLASAAADAAFELGEQVTVAGLSLGGVLAGWLAQERAFDRAVLIAPLFGLKRVPGPLHPVLAGLARALPNRWIWWDARVRADLPPAHGYPRFSTHAYSTLFSVAGRVLREARRSPPRARSLAVVTNAAEPGLDNRFTDQLVRTWRHWGKEVATHEFPEELRLPHDLVDPSNPEQRTDLVYPVLLRMLE